VAHEDFYVHDELWDSICPDDEVEEWVENGDLSGGELHHLHRLLRASSGAGADQGGFHRAAATSIRRTTVVPIQVAVEDSTRSMTDYWATASVDWSRT
jgi:hypothetical protein